MKEVVTYLIIAVTVIVLAGGALVGCDRYSERKQEVKITCIKNGGIWTQDKCVYSRQLTAP